MSALPSALVDIDRAFASGMQRTTSRRKPGMDSGGGSDTSRTIKVVAGELHHTATAAENAILSSGADVFQRGPQIVRPVTHEVPASNGRTTTAAGFGQIKGPAMVDILCSAAIWTKFDGRSKNWVRINPPGEVAQTLLSREGRWRLPAVAGIITTPTLRPDGSLLSKAGYDAATRLYLVPDADLKLSTAVQSPTRKDAEHALDDLNSLLTEFPFIEETGGDEKSVAKAPKISRAVALSGFITPVARGALSVAPLHAFRANTAGTGKSFLVDLVSAVSLGRPCPVISAGSDEAEMEKRVGGLLLAGFPVVSIDNVNGELGGDLLAQAVERPFVQIRRLGGSDIIEVESKSSIFATGNQLRVRGDMVRRTLVAELDAGMERPETRQFKGNPVATVLADRGRYVSACLIIVRAYVLAGRPETLSSLASFDDWSRVVRSALVWLGCADPAASMESARDDDPELSELREMLGLWETAFGLKSPLTAREAAARSEETLKMTHDGHGDELRDPIDTGQFRSPELQDALQRIAGERGSVNTLKLGNWLKSREKRPVGTKRFRKDGESRDGVALWIVEDIAAGR